MSKKLTDKQKLKMIRRALITSIYLYGPTRGRDCYSALWECLKIMEPSSMIEKLTDDPGKVYKKLYGDEDETT